MKQTARPTRTQHDQESQDGFALVLALILVTVVSGLCMGFVQLASVTSKAQTGSVDQMRAFYLAEAGLAEAFHAVRMGRSGRIGSPTNGATYGDGVLWVESAATPDRKVWLRATAVVGGGRAMLGLIVEPDPPPLGFFAQDELVIESTVLADGFNSAERSYEDEVRVVHSSTEPDPEPELNPFVVDDSVHRTAQIAANDHAEFLTSCELLSILDSQVSLRVKGKEEPNWTLAASPLDPESLLAASEYESLLSDLLMMKLAREGGGLTLKSEAEAVRAGGKIKDKVKSKDSHSDVRTMASEGSIDDPSEVSTAPNHTLSGAALGSNGDISFLDSEATSVVFGSVTPGAGRQVHDAGNVTVSGSTEPRAVNPELPPVEVPDLGDSTDIIHAGAITLVVAAGDHNIHEFSVAAGSDVIVRGPTQLVIHDLTLEGGSSLVLDTRDGDVELFITGSVHMDPASFVETTASTAKEVTIQAGVASPGDASPTLTLSAQAPFHGTIYAPTASVRIGGDFEVFGSVVAQRLEIGQGARLHFDDESYSGTMGVPEQDTWQILDLPKPTERPSRGVGRLSGILGGMDESKRLPLAIAHRLEDVAISVRYLDKDGAEQSFAGAESDFDWSRVESIQAQERIAARTAITETAGETALASPLEGEGAWNWDATFQDQVEDVVDWFGDRDTSDPSADAGDLAATATVTRAQADAAKKSAKDAAKEAETAVEKAVKAAEKAAKAQEKAEKAAEKAAKESDKDPDSKKAAKAEEKAAKEEEKALKEEAKATAADARAAVAVSDAAEAAAAAAEAKAALAEAAAAGKK